jgi:nitrous oxide reductase accessory protein NosL
MRRRDLIKLTSVAVALGAAGTVRAEGCPGDGTPAQFIPKRPADPSPVENDLAKYPKCPYCGMDRKEYHRTRMLVHFSDDLPDPTCSLHCAAISLSINVDRAPKAIYVADNAAEGEPLPLVPVEKASFLIGGDIKGVMTKRSKLAYGKADAASAAQAKHGGEVGDFDKALLAAHTDMAEDVKMIRMKREERRRHAEQQKPS